MKDTFEKCIMAIKQHSPSVNPWAVCYSSVKATEDLLKLIRKKAKSLGIKGEIKRSSKAGKRFQIILPNGKIIHFGAEGYENYLEHKNEHRKNQFHSRFASNKGYNDPESGLFYSRMLLW